MDLQELLTSAAESVRSLADHRKQKILMEGAEGLQLSCDLGWTAEALANILKTAASIRRREDVFLSVRSRILFIPALK